MADKVICEKAKNGKCSGGGYWPLCYHREPHEHRNMPDDSCDSQFCTNWPTKVQCVPITGEEKKNAGK